MGVKESAMRAHTHAHIQHSHTHTWTLSLQVIPVMIILVLFRSLQAAVSVKGADPAHLTGRLCLVTDSRFIEIRAHKMKWGGSKGVSNVHTRPGEPAASPGAQSS